MPQNASLSNGVWLEIQITDARGGEIFSAPANSNGLANHLEVAWRHSWRSANIRVTHEIVQGTGSVSFLATASPSTWTEAFLRVRYRMNRNASAALSVTYQTGQAVFDCNNIEVFDIWQNRWVPTPGGLQLTLQIT